MNTITLVIINFLILTLALFLCEYFWKRGMFKGEEARKLMHIIGGLFVATWPLYLSWYQIKVLLVLTVFLVLLVRYSGWFKSFYDIGRRSWGEILYILALVVTAMFDPPIILFEAVILNIALADGFAAVIGKRFGKKSLYKIFGHAKSVAGTITFFLVSLLVMSGIFLIADLPPSTPFYSLIIISLATTFAENIGGWGIDNALIAITTATSMYCFNWI